MRIGLKINGREVQLDGPTPLPVYLDTLGVDLRAVAVEVNEKILDRSAMATAVLQAGDVVEIVKMVGGGRDGKGEDDPEEVIHSAPETEDAEKAAHQAVEPDRLLPGEPGESRHPEDALHWAGVYRELIEFKDRAIDKILLEAVAMSEVARGEVERTDLVVMRSERERFRRRAGHWRRQYQWLTDADASDESRR